MANQVSINRRQLMIELSVAEPIFVKEATRVLKQEYFDPAVVKMKEAFEEHPVTKEIKGGLDADNISNTLIGDFRHDDDKGDSKANLTSFIGFEGGSDPVAPIEARLDPSHADGPKLKYKGKDRDNLVFNYEVTAPNYAAIEKATPLPWGSAGISWAKRIEQGIPGVGYFLNSLKRRGSRSGGGIQVENQLRGGTYRATSYLSVIFKAFLQSIARH